MATDPGTGGRRPGPLTALAFDFGYARIGVAVGQTLTGSARALVTLRGNCPGPDWNAIEAVVREWSPQMLVVGLPLHADGSGSAMCDAARDFANELGARTGRPIEMVDEHLTSNAAEATLREARQRGDRKRRVRKTDIDALAAELILRDWLSAYAQGETT